MNPNRSATAVDEMPSLGKWPRLLVAGEPVTQEQANNILIRTQCWPPFTNDRAWEREIAGILAEHGGPTPLSNGWGWDGVREWGTRIRAVDLSYLSNERIASAWYGGPHGWCDWNGTIAASTWNIGKWPTVEEVADDWQNIAAAWPFLRLRAQLVPDEGQSGTPAVEWLVADGRVETSTSPTRLIAQPVNPQFRPRHPGRERGVSPARLREAINQVRRGGNR